MMGPEPMMRMDRMSVRFGISPQGIIPVLSAVC
jgi:hypothetical protein